MIGLDLDDISVDGSITNTVRKGTSRAFPCRPRQTRHETVGATDGAGSTSR